VERRLDRREIGAASADDVHRDAAEALQAQAAWAATAAEERAAVMTRAGELLERHHRRRARDAGLARGDLRPGRAVLPFSTPSSERGRAIARRLRTGLVHIGDQTVDEMPGAPFGGMGVSGNGGRFGGTANLEEFTQWHWGDRAAPEPATSPS
jgi:acyl-CoA reductase-like NAD-dependent aldehyde dehydrogenase